MTYEVHGILWREKMAIVHHVSENSVSIFDDQICKMWLLRSGGMPVLYVGSTVANDYRLSLSYTCLNLYVRALRHR